jgi:CRP/FNR family transcriptional regulator, cyclic AMP receptor protein
MSSKSTSLYEDAKASLRSLVIQAVLIFGLTLLAVLITGGFPNKPAAGFIFISGIAFVAWMEKTRLQASNVSHTNKNLVLFNFNSQYRSKSEILDVSNIRKVLERLKELADSDIDWLIQSGSLKNLFNGDTLIYEKKRINELYFVIEGSFEVSTISRSIIFKRTELNLNILSDSQIVGEMSFLRGTNPSATVRALGKSLVWSIPYARLSEKLRQDSEFAARFNLMIAIVLADRLTKANNLSSSNSKKLEIEVKENLRTQDPGIPEPEVATISQLNCLSPGMALLLFDVQSPTLSSL